MSISITAQSLSPEELITKSIEYHDPENHLYSKDFNYYFDESRPDGGVNKTVVRLAPKTEQFQIDRSRNGIHSFTTIKKGVVQFFIDGKEVTDTAALKKAKLNPKRAQFMKDYYLYLWHLPVKLQDPGTVLDSKVVREEFNERDCYKLGVRYEEKVGKDRWYFYFDTKTYALLGYRFYHDESKNDGEYIYLEGEYTYDLVRLPKTRKWYTHKEDKYLGTDSLTKMVENE